MQRKWIDTKALGRSQRKGENIGEREDELLESKKQKYLLLPSWANRGFHNYRTAPKQIRPSSKARGRRTATVDKKQRLLGTSERARERTKNKNKGIIRTQTLKPFLKEGTTNCSNPSTRPTYRAQPKTPCITTRALRMRFRGREV
jgi:hypothetical protein